jgi:hypothetical protein
MMKKNTGIPNSDTEDQDISSGGVAGALTVMNFTSAFQLGSASGSVTAFRQASDTVSLSFAATASTNAALVMGAVTTGALSKLDSQLAALHLSHSSMAADATAFTSMVQQFAGSISENGQYVVIDATAADGNGSGLLGDLQQIGLIGGSSFGAMASGWLPIDQIETLAGLSDLNFARESVMATNVGSVTTQADHALASDTARSTYGVNGAGVKVGIISDSFNFLGGYNANIASGDLPAGVQILQDSGSTDEGRGMAQLVYDIAPGASLAFATAQGGQANFANNIIALKNAGARVIVDDVSYFAETMFQDGVIAQAVDQVSAAGAVYFSSAANNGHKGYEAGFLSSGTTQIIGGRSETLHNYDSASPTTFMPFTLASNRTVTVVLEWNQPAASVSPGHGATSDLDLFVYNASGTIISTSQASNIGRDPIEVVQFSNFSGTTQTYRIAVGLSSGAAPSDFKIVTFNGNGTVSNGFASNTNDGTVYGHAAATSAIAVGAASYAQTPGFGVNPALIESFSSGGPTRIFFDKAGNPISVVRQTPQITAPDGGNTSFFGADDGDADSFPNFYGTSAAAPAAAAVAALLLQANGSLTPAAIKTVLMNSAIDMDNPATPGFDTGFDAGTGAGLIQANAALAMVTSSVAINDVTITEGNSGTKVANFTVTRTDNSAAADVNFTAADGSATVADHDYIANSGTLHFNAGVGAQTISVIVTGDAKPEADEFFFVNLSGGSGLIIGDGIGRGTITDDDTRFGEPSFELSAFARSAGSWTDQTHYPRHVADVNGDGMADIVGFAADGVVVALATGNGHFGALTSGIANFGFNAGAGGWTSQDQYPRLLADVNGDGMADIIGFGADRVGVSLATGNGQFASPVPGIQNFTFNAGGWVSDDQYPRQLADVNGDGMADIVGFGADGVMVSLATGNGHFASPVSGIQNFAFNAGGWVSQDQYPRELADVNGDHMADIIGFGADGVVVSLATGNGHFASPVSGIQNFAFNPGAGGWTSEHQYPRLLADVNGDGMADIIGFGADQVSVSLATGNGHFASPVSGVQNFAFNAGGWASQDVYPRALGDVNGGGSADIIGFGEAGVYEALSNGFHLV